jgi:UDP-N-acetyl-2-amino-2-deoxyglucuronate dehydrogenase
VSDGNGGRGAPRFALIGAAGFVARRHLDAIRAVGGTLVAACDVNDSVGVLDSFFPHTRFFLSQDDFAAFLRIPANRVDYVAVCTPSDLHEEHCMLALSTGAGVILEKPPVLDPAGVGRLAARERQVGRPVHPVLQLRYHPEIEAFRAAVQRRPGRNLDIVARYVARRGPWYHVSWKGDPRRSGSIVYNFGIHLFDVLTWIFGPATEPPTAWMDDDGSRAGGTVRFAGATARWILSSRAEDLPDGGAQTYGWRHFLVDDRVVADFSGDYSGLHRKVYEEVVAGRGHRIEDAFEATVLTDQILRATGDSGIPGGPVLPSFTSAPA